MTSTELVQQAKARANENVRQNVKLLKSIKGRTDAEIALGMGEKKHWVQQRLSNDIKISVPDAAAFAAYFDVPISVLHEPTDSLLRVLSEQGFSPSGWMDEWASGWGNRHIA